MRSELSDATYFATKGLLAYRSGQADEGRRLYEVAVERASHRAVGRELVSALLHYAREEQHYRPDSAYAIRERARELMRGLAAWEQAVYRVFVE